MRDIAARRWALFRTMAAAAMLAALASCGGGDDGASRPALGFSPASVTANVVTGDSATVTVRATAGDATILWRAPHVYVRDSAGVLLPGVELAMIDDRSFSATVHTSPHLPAGRHQGTLQVELCHDVDCASPLPGSPVPLPYDLAITPVPLVATPSVSTSQTVHRGGSVDTSVVVDVTGPSLAWTATSPAGWLALTPGNGTGAGSFTASFVTPTLAEGSYTTDVTVRSSDGQTVVLPFSLTVLPTQFTLTSGMPSFHAINGAPIAAQPLSFSLDNGVPAAWSATSSAPWMLATPLSGTTPATITLQPDPTRGPLASGIYSSDLVLSSAGVLSRTVPAQLALAAPTLSAQVQTLTFGGPRGRDFSASQAQTLALSLNTGANNWPYTVSGLPDWLSSSALSGTVGANGSTLTLSPRMSGVTPGSSTATVNVAAAVNGDTAVLPVTVNLNADERRLTASEWAVAFTTTPTAAEFTRTVTIGDSFGVGGLSWTARSDAHWLSVTANGDTWNAPQLVLTASPVNASPDALSYANVTVSTGTAGVKPVVIRVALWRSSTTPSAASLSLPSSLGTVIVADTLRPYVYVTHWRRSILVYNAYTAQLVGSIPTGTVPVGQMSVSPDGSRLYALDTLGQAIVVVDLDAMAVSETWPLTNAVNQNTAVLAVRPAGGEIVLVGDGTAYADGRSLGESRVMGADGPLVATVGGRNVYSLSAHYSVDHSAMSGGVVFSELLHALDTHSGGAQTDVAVNASGTRVYAAAVGGMEEPARYRCVVVDGTNGSYLGSLPTGSAYPNNVEVTRDGRVICGGSSGDTSDLWVYSPAGTLLQSHRAANGFGIRAKQMVVTPDGFMVAVITANASSPRVSFVPIGAP